MAALLLLHLVVGLAVIAAGVRARRWAIPVSLVPPLATVTWLATVLGDVFDAEVKTERISWIPGLDVAVELRLDGFSALMLLLVSGIGVLVVIYSMGYFTDPHRHTVRLMGLLTLFAGSMAGLVLADNLLVLYGFWELTSITSFFLIGNRHEDLAARAAALQALLVTGLGGLAMLVGFIVLGQAAGTYRLSELLAEPPRGGTVVGALILVLLGAFTKSAQYPFHSWLPGAMVAPTPVSAYLHSATMVKAGVYLVGRLAPAFATLGMWRPLVVGVGVVTMIAGGMRALRQHDLKLLLAMGTISQLGFMMVILGWGTRDAVTAGAVILLAHGAFKAACFMIVGILDHQHGTRDVRQLPRLGRPWLVVGISAAVSAGSMAGVPLLFGFIGKEADYDALYEAGTSGRVTLAFVVVGSIFTTAYSLRFVLGVLGRLAAPDERVEAGAPPGARFVGPVVVLSAVTVLLGLVPALADSIADAATVALAGVGDAVHLAIWHGITVPLELSLLALVVGAWVGFASERLRPRMRWGDRLPTASDGYRATLFGVNVVADRVTRIAQPGSLPIYLGVILVTAATVPGVALLTSEWWPGWPELVTTPMHVAVIAVILGFGLAATAVHRRFSAALFLGMTGYGMAGLFLVQGAPDLALTQVAIETLTMVLFVLVLRRLPDRFETSGREHRALRRTVSVGVGGLVFALALAVGVDLPATDVSDAMIEQAYPEADGRNVVNVILVDFRGYDTLGELTVLTAAAIGTVALARSGRRQRTEAPDTDAPDRGEHVPAPVPLRRLVSVEVSVRIVFAAVVVGSLWLLFAGHNQPGGGFAGGIVAGAAVALRYVSGGIDEVRRLSRGKPWIVLGGGLLVSVVTALVPLLIGHSVLESTAWTFDLPVFGEAKLPSPLFFDIGVYLAVIGLALMVFESFGDDAPPTALDAEDTPAQPDVVEAAR
jgi:multicomponent Na+:H+ antiporter subunit A